MKREELEAILAKHVLWLQSKSGGEKANLWRANLVKADLREADLRGANLVEADLREAKLWRANLVEADLREAKLEGADLDFSAWPLWCGTRGVIVDKRLACQLAAHFCVLVCGDDEVKAAQQALLPLARQSHRAKDLGL